MVKILVAVRLAKNIAEDLKKLALENKVSQGEIVSEGIALFKLKMLYKKEGIEQEKQACYTKGSGF